jgi:hypothetical protein
VTQIRVMDDDPGLAREVLDLLLRCVAREDSGLRAGSVTELRHRGGGGRYVVDVMPTGQTVRPAGGPVWVDAERVDDRPARRPGRGRGGRALPPA